MNFTYGMAEQIREFNARLEQVFKIDEKLEQKKSVHVEQVDISDHRSNFKSQFAFSQKDSQKTKQLIAEQLSKKQIKKTGFKFSNYTGK